VLQARFDSLSPVERRLLQRASVIGRIFWDRAVAALSEESQTVAPDSLVSGLLNALRSREMIYPRQPSAFEATQEYLFRHALLRDVTYETMLKRERRLYHAHAARWLEEVTERSQRADEYAARIADHYDQGGENGTAAAWYLRAGQGAASRFANAEALRLLSRALELATPDEKAFRFDILQAREKVYSLQAERESQAEDQRAMSNLADELDDDACRAQVALRRANLFEATGEYEQAIEQASQVVMLARLVGKRELEANGYLVWGSALYRQSEYQASRERFERALELAQQGQSPGIEADARRSIGIAYEMQSNFPEAGSYLMQALAIYRSTNDRRGESMCLNSLGVLAFHQGDLATARQHYEMSVRLKREFGDRYSEGITLTNLGIVAHQQGDPEASQRYFEQGLNLSREIGDREGEAADLTGLGSRALYLGDYSTTRRFLEQALSICREIGDRQGESGILSSLGQLEYLTGNYRAAEAPCREALKIAREMEGPAEQGYALTFLGQSLFPGRLDGAWEAYQEAYRIRQNLQQTGLGLDDLAGLAQVELARGKVAHAQVYAQEILDHLLKQLDAGPEETATVYLALYQILAAARDPRAQAVLESGYAWLQERAARIKEEASRLSFLENVPTHRQLAATWEMSNLEE
jgi:tetratricopeptide (TPR) repeat protein